MGDDVAWNGHRRIVVLLGGISPAVDKGVIGDAQNEHALGSGG